MKYFIQDTRQVVGNCAVWWRYGGAGYTADLREAGQFSYAQAKEICDSRKSDAMRPVQAVKPLAALHVDVERLRWGPASATTDQNPEEPEAK